MLFGDIYTKSETYQKEGWFILEEENQVFGKDAEAVDSNINLESEDFNFYHQNKEEAKKNIDSSSADLSDFIDSLIQDIPDPSAEEVNSGIEKILERTQPEEAKNKISKNSKSKKVTFRVLFLAALLSILSVSCLFVVGSNHDISIENGFVTFAKDTIKIVFFGEDKEEYITVDALLNDLEAHGYKDILFPQEFVNNYDVYKASVPEYSVDLTKQVTFDIYNDTVRYLFSIHSYNSSQHIFDYVGMENIETETINGIKIYLFDFGDNDSAIEFVYKNWRYRIQSQIPYYKLLKLIETINQGEK